MVYIFHLEAAVEEEDLYRRRRGEGWWRRQIPDRGTADGATARERRDADEVFPRLGAARAHSDSRLLRHQLRR